MSEDMKIEGEPDSKPYKLYRVDSEGREIQPRIAEYATEGELRAHKRRLKSLGL